MGNVLVSTDTGIRWMGEAERADYARAAQRREVLARLARVDKELGREQATRERRRTLPRLTDAVARGMEALLHRAVPDRHPATPTARQWLDHCPLGRARGQLADDGRRSLVSGLQ